MGYSLDDKYSVTCGSTKVVWYSLCMIWSKGGASGSSIGLGINCVVCWVCGREFCGCVSGVF